MSRTNCAKRILAFVLTAAFLLVLAPSGFAAQEEGKVRIKVFETNDLHGFLMDTSSGDESTFKYNLAYIAQVVKDARASGEYDGVLLVDGGDGYEGTITSNLLYGSPMRAAMDTMDYDAATLGNHEFDWDVRAYAADADATVAGYELDRYVGDPDTPIVVSNLYYADSGERADFTRDYTIAEKAGCRIAIVGYVAQYSADIMTAKIAPYSIDPSIEHLTSRIREINAQEKPDVTIVLAHENPKDIAALLDPEDVALVAGGHDHGGRSGYADSGVAYIQADYQAKGYADAVIVLDKATGAVTVEDPAYRQIVGTELEARLYETPENAAYLDPEILEISHAAWKSIGANMGEVLGYIDTPIQKKGLAEGDNGATTGGDWTTGLMLEWAQKYGAVAAFYNRDGVRTDFVIPEGQTTRNVTVADIYSIAPFNNYWRVYELTGAELAQQLHDGLTYRNFGDQVSGLTFTYYQLGYGDEDASSYEIASITLSDGTQVDIHDTKTAYRVCVSNYSATLAGSVFEGKEPLYPDVDAPVDNVTIIELLRAKRDAGDAYIPVDTSARAVRLPVCPLHEDVSENAWCHAAVDYVMNNGLMVGVSARSFGPSQSVTRAMAVAVLYRLAEKPAMLGTESAFSDVTAGKWYSDAVAWAAKNGIAAGYTDGSFGLGDAVTREQLVCFLWRYFGAEEADESVLDDFADGAAVSRWARQAFAWAIGAGVVHGDTQGLLDPKGAASRAQYAQILFGLQSAAEDGHSV